MNALEPPINTDLITLIVPVFNESSMIFANLKAIIAAATGENYDIELLVVDDGSKDDSAIEIARAAQEDPRIRLISFTRNFGKEAAIQAGLQNATGDAGIVLDGDLQHPPELIPKMIQLWRDGFFVVDAIKFDRGDKTFHEGLFARAFYVLFSRSTGLNLKNHSDFKLIDRMVIDTYLNLPERQRFFRGLIYWAQYPSAQIPFSVAERAGGGVSQWSKLKLLKYALNNITSFSSLPLKVVGLVGVLSLLLGAIIGILSLVQKLAGNAIDGFTTVNLLIIIMSGAILVSLGIIGHYIGRIYEELKGRPTYLIKPTRKQ